MLLVTTSFCGHTKLDLAPSKDFTHTPAGRLSLTNLLLPPAAKDPVCQLYRRWTTTRSLHSSSVRRFCARLCLRMRLHGGDTRCSITAHQRDRAAGLPMASDSSLPK